MKSEVKSVLLVGPCVERTKGGMATFIKGILNDEFLNRRYQIKYLPSHAEISFLPKLFLGVLALFKICLEHKKYEVLHLHVADGASFYRKGIMAVFGNSLGMKVIFHLHAAGFDNFYSGLTWFGRKCAWLFFFSSSKIVVLSDFWKHHLISEGFNQKIAVVPNAINIDSYKESINSDPEFNSFLFLGRLCKRKGIYDLIEVVNKLKKADSSNCFKFYFAGDGDIEGVSRIVANHRLEKHVEIVGWVDEKSKKALMKKVDFIVLPSYEEGLPISLLEGLASGKIIISTRIGGIPEIVSDEVNGFLINPGDQKRLLGIFLKIKSFNKDCLIKMSFDNIQKAHCFYDFKILRKNLVEIYSH